MKKNIYICLLSLALLITTSFAWINVLESPSGSSMLFSLKDGNAVVASNEIEVTLYIDETGDDDYVDISRDYKRNEPTHNPFQFNNFAPGDRVKYMVEIKNVGASLTTVLVVLSDITSDTDGEGKSLLSYVTIGTSGYAGNFHPYKAPDISSFNMKEAFDRGNGSVQLVSGLNVPAKSTVTIYFYLFFDRQAKSDTSGKTFTIGAINFISV